MQKESPTRAHTALSVSRPRVCPRGSPLARVLDVQEELNALVEKFHRQLANASATKSSVFTSAATTAPPAELNSSPLSFSNSSASSRASAQQAENRPILSGLTGATGSRAAKELQEQIADKAQDVSALEQGRERERERSCVYWKPTGAAAERASPSAHHPQSCPLMFGGRCLVMDLEGKWGRC